LQGLQGAGLASNDPFPRSRAVFAALAMLRKSLALKSLEASIAVIFSFTVLAMFSA
jgi:hypothetical protein